MRTVYKIIYFFLSWNIKISPQKAPKRKLSKEGDDGENETVGATSSKKLCEDENSEKDKNSCIYKKLLENIPNKTGCTFWKNGWRAKLCVCQTCKVGCGIDSTFITPHTTKNAQVATSLLTSCNKIVINKPIYIYLWNPVIGDFISVWSFQPSGNIYVIYLCNLYVTYCSIIIYSISWFIMANM